MCMERHWHAMHVFRKMQEDVACSGAAPRVAVACDDGVARLFTAEPGQPGLGYAKSLPSLGSRVLSVAWHPSGQSLLLGTAAGTLHAWALASGRELLRINVGALLLLLLMAFPGGTSSTSAKKLNGALEDASYYPESMILLG